jgi:hypothetical protein
MSSETSTKRARPADGPTDDTVGGFQPWHLFLIGTLLASAAAAVAVRGTRPANVVFVCLTIMAAGLAAFAAYRTLWPLVQPGSAEAPEMLGGRTRAALEREKTLVLRSIKDLEFDRAMGKVSESDWHEMTTKLRSRAIRLIRQLDSGSAAYRELIEKELAGRRAAAAKATILVLVLVGALASPAGAQMSGSGGMAGMPDARAMSGIPRPEAALPTGTVSVRLVRGQLANLVAGHPVEFIVNGKSETVKTDETGHAVLSGLAAGSAVHVVATVEGERLDSQDFDVAAQGGIVLMLVASDTTAAEQMAKAAVPGTVTIGGQSRVITQFEEEVLQVYYLFDIMNGSPAPVKTGPLVFDLPPGAENATVLEGSTRNAVARGPTITVTGPFPPGLTSVQIAYSLPPAARVSIRQALPVSMAQVVVMMEKLDGMVIASPQVTTLREGNEGGKVFVLGEGPALKAGDVLAVDITGLPHHAAWPGNTALALGVLALAAGVWASLRTDGRSAAVASRQQLEKRREQVFGELLRLEQRQKAGQVDAGAFEGRRRELVAELERIYGELDTAAAGPHGDQGLAA